MTPTSPAPTPDDSPAGNQPLEPRAAAVTQAQLAETLARIDRHVRRWGHERHWPAADIDDARQEAELAVVYAAQHFDPHRKRAPADYAWRRLVGLVVKHTLSNFRRGQRRFARRYVPITDLARLLEEDTLGSGTVRLLVSGEEDPALVAQWHEEQLRQAIALRGLTDDDRRLCELLESGISLREIARQLGITLNVLRGRIARLRTKLKTALGDAFG